MTITWSVLADFDRNGSYEYDLTDDIEMPGSGINIDRGFGNDGIYQISKVSITVTNRSGTYVFDNSSSALYGKLRAGVPIRVAASDGSNSYTLWTGYIQKYRMSGFTPSTVPTCTFECTDLAGFLAQLTPLNVLIGTRTTKEAYEAVATAAQLTGADFQFSGLQSLPLHWVRNTDALTAMAQIQQSEMGGQWFVDALGRIQGQGRGTRLGIAVSATWGDGSTIYPRAVQVDVVDDDVISTASVQPNIFVADADEQVVFTFSRNASNPTPDSLYIGPGETYGPVSLDYPSPVEQVAVQVSGTDYTANSAIDGSGTDMTSSLSVLNTEQGAGFELTLKNTNTAAGLYVTLFQKKGLSHSYVPDRPIFTYGLPIAGDKTSRGITVQLPFASDDTLKARDFAVQLVRTYRYPYPRLTLAFDAGSDAATLASMLSVELGDLVQYRDTDVTGLGKSYSNDYWYVDHIKHVAPPNMAGQNFGCEVQLVPSYLFRNLDAIVYDQWERDATNLCTNADMELSATGWTAGGGATVARSTAFSHSGTASLQVVAAAQFDSAIFACTVPANSFVRFGCWVYFASGGNVFVDLSDGGDQDLNGVNFSCAAGTWTYVYHEGTTDSDTARNFHVYLNQVAGDTFYIDDVSISTGLGTSTSYDAWSGDNSWDIVTGYARANEDSLQMPVLDLGPGATDQVVEVLLSEIGSGDEVGVVFRYTDSNNQYRFYVDAGTNEAILEKSVEGTVTELSSPAYTVGTTAELRVIEQGGRIRCQVDGLTYIDTTDAPVFYGTKCGLFARNASGTTKFNEFYGQGLNGSTGVAESRMPEITPMRLRRHLSMRGAA